MQVDENMLIARILDGRVRDYGYFLERYGDEVLALVSRIVPRQSDAEDIVQDVFVKAYDKLATFNRQAGFSTWLFRIAYNAAISWTRKQKLSYVAIDERVVVDDAVVDDALSADTEERIERLEAAIEKLKPEEKMLITLFYFDDKRHSEIAYIMGIDEGNVSIKLHRIRKKLYLLMEGRINERR